MIVDASVVIAALLADGSVRRRFLHHEGLLVAPGYLREETLRKVPMLSRRTGLSQAVVVKALQGLFERVQFIPAVAYARELSAAQAACKAAHAGGDEDYVALAFATGDVIWSLDRDFDRIKGVRRIAAP